MHNDSPPEHKLHTLRGLHLAHQDSAQQQLAIVRKLMCDLDHELAVLKKKTDAAKAAHARLLAEEKRQKGLA